MLFFHILSFTLALAVEPDPNKCAQNFVASVSHDLKNPISAAHTAANLLLRITDPVHRQKLTLRIINNLERANLMITDLLDANAMNHGNGVQMKVEDCKDLRPVLEEIIQDMETIHGARFQLIADKEVSGRWDLLGIRRAVENLITNAVKYGDQSKPIVITLRRNGDAIRLSVKNDGEPLSIDEITRITERHERLERHVERAPGWGVGLTIVSGIVEAHGGSLSVESAPEQGVTFSLTLPSQPK